MHQAKLRDTQIALLQENNDTYLVFSSSDMAFLTTEGKDCDK